MNMINNKESQWEHTATKLDQTEHAILNDQIPPSTYQVRQPHNIETTEQEKIVNVEKKTGAAAPSTSFSAREAPLKKEPKKTLPEMGQPGGRDDPLRRGLSGAGIRWYLRYLEQGLTPEEARKKADEHKCPSQVIKTLPKDLKRKHEVNNTTSPQQKKDKKKKEGTTSVSGSYATVVRTERVVILPKTFPGTTLSAKDLTLLEEALVEEMFSGWDYKLKFGGIHFRPGMLLIDCETPQSAEWLREKVPHLSNWKGVELQVRARDDIPKSHTAKLFLPRSQGQTTDKLLKLIEAQNEGLSTTLWKIVSKKDEGKGQILRIELDDLSYKRIKNNGYTIHYRFGKVTVQGLKRTEEEEYGEKLESSPSTSRGGYDAKSSASLNLPTVYIDSSEEN